MTDTNEASQANAAAVGHFDPEDPVASKTYTTTEVGKMFDVTSETVRDWIVKGHLPAVRLPSGTYRIHRSTLVEFGTSRYQSTPVAPGGGAEDLL